MNSEYLNTLSARVQDTLEGDEGREALIALDQAAYFLKELFERDPTMAVRGELFEQTEILTNHARTLAQEFARRQDFVSQERSLELRLLSVRTAYTHRRNIVGPTILELANCNKLMGNRDKANSLYDSLVRDLSQVLGWGPSFDRDWLSTVECLQQALLNSDEDYGDLKEKTARMLEDSRKMLKPLNPLTAP